jgi:hypothetical protein
MLRPLENIRKVWEEEVALVLSETILNAGEGDSCGVDGCN